MFEATLIGAEGFQRPVAVKRIQPALSSDATFGKMFVNEARIASLLHHPNIAAVLDFDRDDDGRFFLVMELIRGLDLRQLMESGRLPVAIAVHIAAEMLRGLGYAHELEHEGRRLGIVHRDVSPHNVMVSWDGAVKLVDFGIAKAMAATSVSRGNTIKGKVAYMSPEQASAAELDERTDIFAVGVVLHEMLVGDRLFRGATEPEILARVLSQPIPQPIQLEPTVPTDLDQIVMKMLERDREARYPTAHSVVEALLNTSATSARAGLELGQLLAARFPGQARRRSSAAPERVTIQPSRSVSPVAQTMPAGPVGLAARADAGSPGRAPVRTLTEAPGPPVTAPRRGRPWLAGMLVTLVAAGVTGGLLLMREQKVERAQIGSPDAAVAAVASEPVEPVEPVPPDAGAVTAAPPADAAPAVTEDRTTRRRREAEPGYLDVSVDPWAYVSVNGKEYGQTPKKIPLPPGTHQVVLTNSELRKRERVKVRIKSRQTRSLDRKW